MIRRTLLLALLFSAGAAWAIDAYNQTLFGVAIKGYDPVAYFEDQSAQKGSKKFQTSWQDATWHFVSQANLDMFKADPQKYAPQYGGYCAWAVSQGYTAGIDPKAWKVVDGKLYLNYNQKIKRKWEAEMADFIQKADQNWPSILKK